MEYIEIFFDTQDSSNPGWVARIPANSHQSCDWILESTDPLDPEEAVREVRRRFPADCEVCRIVIHKD